MNAAAAGASPTNQGLPWSSRNSRSIKLRAGDRPALAGGGMRALRLNQGLKLCICLLYNLQHVQIC
ncbi:MAG: hypothetical protein M3Z21_14345, partial [Pseudomonadota bacterium]|nr:hypothetical protein [Pseudomonadota bacterium]